MTQCDVEPIRECPAIMTQYLKKPATTVTMLLWAFALATGLLAGSPIASADSQVLTGQGSAQTGEIQLFSPPTHGLWLTPKQKKTPLYGPSSPEARWRVSQWQSPVEALPPFTSDRTGNDALDIRLEKVDGRLYYTITQNGKSLICNKNGKPYEFDAFISAITNRHYKNQKAAQSIRNLKNIRMDSIGRLMHKISVTPIKVENSAEALCAVNRAVLMTAIVMRNEVARQTFFYQLRLKRIGFSPRPLWWAKGKKRRFGFGDNLASFGEQEAEWGETTTYRLDLAGRIKELIQSGAHGIDPNLKNWYISATYHGNALWGNLNLEAKWGDFELTSTKAH